MAEFVGKKDAMHRCVYSKKLTRDIEIYIKCGRVFESSEELEDHIRANHSATSSIETQTIEQENSGLPYCTECERYCMAAVISFLGGISYLCRYCDAEQLGAKLKSQYASSVEKRNSDTKTEGGEMRGKLVENENQNRNTVDLMEEDNSPSFAVDKHRTIITQTVETENMGEPVCIECGKYTLTTVYEETGEITQVCSSCDSSIMAEKG